MNKNVWVVALILIALCAPLTLPVSASIDDASVEINVLL